jgi:hypothetical protein
MAIRFFEVREAADGDKWQRRSTLWPLSSAVARPALQFLR